MNASARQLAIANENRSIDESQDRAIASRGRPRNALEAMAHRLEVSPEELKATLVKTVFKDCRSESEFLALIVVSNEYGLNPLTKEIYAFPAKGGGVVPMVSVDGWNRIMNDHPSFDGIEFDYHMDDKGNVDAIESVIYRKDRSRPTKTMEFMVECKRETDPWKKSPRRMLRHRALMQGARIAFGFGGIAVEGDEDAIDGGVIQSTSLPNNKTLGEELDDEIPAFDKGGEEEVVNPETGEILPTDPVTGMTEVSEDVARELDRQSGDQAEDEPEEEAAGADGGDPGPQSEAAEPPAYAAKVAEIRNGIAAAKTKDILAASEREYVKQAVSLPKDVADQIETELAAAKKKLGGGE